MTDANKQRRYSRRRFAAALGATALLSGCAGGPPGKGQRTASGQEPERTTTNSSATPKQNPHTGKYAVDGATVDVRIFVGERVAKYHTHSDPLEPGHMVKDALELALSSIPEEDQELDLTVTVADEQVPADVLGTSQKGDRAKAWEKHATKTYDGQDLAADSNLLLTDQRFKELGGQGLVPCQNCDGGNHRFAVVAEAVEIGRVDEEYLSSPRPAKDPAAAALNTAIHEVGHNLGLRHGMGTSWKDDETGRTMVSPMIGKYAGSYSERTNYWGRRMPSITSAMSTHISPTFNSRIPLRTLRTDKKGKAE